MIPVSRTQLFIHTSPLSDASVESSKDIAVFLQKVSYQHSLSYNYSTDFLILFKNFLMYKIW